MDSNDIIDEMRKMKRQMDRFFNNFSSNRVKVDSEINGKYKNAYTDFSENKNEFIVSVELPGVDKKDIHLNLLDFGIEVKAEKKKEQKHVDKKKGEYQYARSYSGYSRTIEFPENADMNKINAEFKKGILVIKVKKRKSKEMKKIKIK